MRRLRRLFIVLVVLLLAAAWRVADQPVLAAEGLSPEALKIANELNCPVCEGQSVRDSNSQLAGEMRQLIQQMLDNGQTPEQIKSYFVQRYGVGILRTPPRQGFVWTLWWGPVAGLVVGLVALVVYFRGRRQAMPAAMPDDAELAEVETAMQRWLTSE